MLLHINKKTSHNFMRTEITIYRGQYEHIEGSVPGFLDYHPWVLTCNVSTIATRPLEHTNEEIQDAMFITSFSNLLFPYIFMCIWKHSAFTAVM